MPATAALFVLLLAAAAPDGGEARARALAEIRAEIGRLQTRLDSMAARATTLEERLARTEVELALQGQQVAEATAALALAVERADAADGEVARLETALEAVGADLRRRLGALYRLGRQGYLRLFLSLQPDEPLLPAIRQLRFLARRDRIALDRYRDTRAALVEERRRLERERRTMTEWRAREEQRRRELAALRRRQGALLARLERERATVTAQTEALLEKAAKLAAFIGALAGDRPPLEGQRIQGFAGVLDWPAEGRVVAGFGPRRDPRYKTEVPHNGIDLATAPGTPVRAVYPGEVLFAGRFEGYGEMVVVHHPGRVFTLYAGLAEVGVTKGDVLSLNQRLGVSAASLYFEIRRENVAEDPLAWLR